MIVFVLLKRTDIRDSSVHLKPNLYILLVAFNVDL